jgi:hypothetical protein
MGGGSSKSIGQAKIAHSSNGTNFKEHDKIEVPASSTQVRPSPPRAIVEERIEFANPEPLDEESEGGNSQNTSMMISIDDIYEAASQGLRELKQHIETSCVDVNLQDSSSGNTALLQACELGDTDTVKTLLEFGVDIAKRNHRGWTCLFSACYAGQDDVVQMLLAHGARTDDQDPNGYTGLIIACNSGRVDVVKTLTKHRCNTNLLSTQGMHSLMYACAAGHLGVVRVLLEQGVDVDLKDTVRHRVTDPDGPRLYLTIMSMRVLYCTVLYCRWVPLLLCNPAPTARRTS